MPSRSVALALAALLGSLAPAAAAVAQSHPIDAKAPDGWRMLESLPPYPKAPCTARMAGREINVNLSLNNGGVPVLILARPDWRGLQGDVVAKISVDGGAAEDLPVGLVNNLALTLVQDPALLQKLKSGHNLTWTLPMGRYEGRIEGFDVALAAVAACVAERDGKAAGTSVVPPAASGAVTAETRSGPVIYYDVVFKALKRSEAQYASLGPVGPYYPDRASRMGLRGGAVIDCKVMDQGRLADCKGVAEKPSDAGFTEAAMIMAKRGVITVGPDAPVGEVVHVRVMFDPTMKAQVEGRATPCP